MCIRDRIEGKRTKAAKAPKEQRGVSLLIDIENSIKAQESRGYEQWAKIDVYKRQHCFYTFFKTKFTKRFSQPSKIYL